MSSLSLTLTSRAAPLACLIMARLGVFEYWHGPIPLCLVVQGARFHTLGFNPQRFSCSDSTSPAKTSSASIYTGFGAGSSKDKFRNECLARVDFAFVHPGLVGHATSDP